MTSLVIADAGLNIKGLSKSNISLPTQVLSLSISDGVIEEMIKCVQNDISIQLSLEDSPSISYGSKTQHLSISNEVSSHEVFRTTVPSAIRVSSKTPIPHPPPNAFANVKMTSSFAATIGENLIAKNPPVVHSSVSGSILSGENELETAGTDAALAALQSSLASESMRKAENTVKYIKDGSLTIPSKRGAVKTLNQSNSRSQKHRLHDTSKTSLPPSPSQGSFSSVPLSQQQAEQAKTTRKPVIHLLAVSPLTQEELEAKIPESTAPGLKQALEKVGDWNQSIAKWELRKAFYKELDVWNFKYHSPENRQKAIDNAVRVFDKMRINVSEPQWERLLPPNERGTGKCLSKLQAQIAQASSQKGSNKTSESGRDSPSANSGTGGSASGGHCSNSSTSRDDSVTGEKTVPKIKGEPTSRTKSNVSTTNKTKKTTGSEKEAQSKRPLMKKAPGGGKSTATMIKNTVPKKNQILSSKDSKTTTNAVLSSEYVHSSDDEDSSSKVASPVAKQRKRPRGYDEVENNETSSSPPKKATRDISLPHRASDVSQNINTSHHNSSQYSLSSKSTKSNSPQKSSPLASSPPTNASDLEESSSSHSPISPSSSPRLTSVSRSPINKTQRKTCPGSRLVANGVRHIRPEVTDLARKYKMYYPKYLELHEQITGMGGRRDRRMEKDLLEMHARLYAMKKEIQAGIVDVDRC